MAWWDLSRSRHHSVSSGHHIRKRSPRRPSSGHYLPRHSAPSVFSLGGRSERSNGSFISSSSSHRARPRSGFISRMIYRIKQLLYKIYYYARHHPIKVFLLVIVPLITGGILQKLLAMVGLRLPRSLRGDQGGSGGYGRDYGTGGGLGGSGLGGSGLGESVKGLMTIAKMFM